jgi:uridine kinase
LVVVVGEGVSGGTASGKTTVCDMIIQQLHDHRVVLVNQVWCASLHRQDAYHVCLVGCYVHMLA